MEWRVTDVYEEERVTAVLIRFPEEYRNSVEAIRNLLVETPSKERIPLSELAEITKSEGPQTIFRENLQRRKIILCNVVGRDINSFVSEAQQRIEQEISFPQGYFVTFGGQFESQQRAMRHLSMVMLIVMLIMFVILFSSFGSLWQATLVMLNIPSTLIGGILGLLLVGETLNVSSTIGLIALFGICAQNDIILVAKINDLRKKGMALREAVIQGALTKFRPIFITDMVMIVGVLPLALIRTTGAELHQAPGGRLYRWIFLRHPAEGPSWFLFSTMYWRDWRIGLTGNRSRRKQDQPRSQKWREMGG